MTWIKKIKCSVLEKLKWTGFWEVNFPVFPSSIWYNYVVFVTSFCYIQDLFNINMSSSYIFVIKWALASRINSVCWNHQVLLTAGVGWVIKRGREPRRIQLSVKSLDWPSNAVFKSLYWENIVSLTKYSMLRSVYGGRDHCWLLGYSGRDYCHVCLVTMIVGHIASAQNDILTFRAFYSLN